MRTSRADEEVHELVEDDTWVVVSTYRAKNGFGALTMHQGRFVIQQG